MVRWLRGYRYIGRESNHGPSASGYQSVQPPEGSGVPSEIIIKIIRFIELRDQNDIFGVKDTGICG